MSPIMAIIIRYRYFALLTSIMLLLLLSNQYFYQDFPSPRSALIFKNSTTVVTAGRSSSSRVSSSRGDNHIGRNNVDISQVFENSLSNKSSITNAPHRVTVDIKYSTSVVSKVSSAGNKGVVFKASKSADGISVTSRNNDIKLTTTLRTVATTSSEEQGIKSALGYNNGNGTSSRETENFQIDPKANWFEIIKDAAGKFYLIFANNKVDEFRTWAVDKQRQLLKEEMDDYKFRPNTTLDDYVLERGGQPIRNLVFTTWRSGSTFLGDILESHPGTYYHYEPLLHFGIVQVRNGKIAQEGTRVIRNLLNCNYKDLTEYLKYGEVQHWVFNHNGRVWKYCKDKHQVCWSPEFLSKMCKMFPFQALKTVRMRLKFARELLQDPKLNIRVLYLVRDPRGTMQSRSHRVWCPNNPDCDNPSYLCSDLAQDYYEALKLRKEYPKRFMVVRYEDMSSNINDYVQKIFKFFRLQYHSKVKTFLEKHTSKNQGDASSTFRDTKAAPFHWMKDMADNFTSIQVIQKSCRKALDLWGYKAVKSPKDLNGFNPVLQPPWLDIMSNKKNFQKSTKN